MIRRLGLAAALALPIAAAACSGKGESEIAIEDQFARETIGTSQVGAAYMTVINSGSGSDTLQAATSPIAETVELHTHEMADGIMRMRRVEEVAIPAGETVAFEPGGLHIMLFDLTAPLTAGDAFPLTLSFAQAGDVTVEVSVVATGHAAPPTHEGMDRETMDHEIMDHDDMGHGAN